jgi:hypothetical protein
MKKLFISLLVLAGISQAGMAAEGSSPLSPTLPPHVVTKSHWKPKPKSEQTQDLEVRKLYGVKCLLARYSNVMTLTVLSGEDRGKQTILDIKYHARVKPKDATCLAKKSHGKMVHRYKWGTVTTTKSKQVIKRH